MKKCTKTEIADAAGISASHLSNILNGMTGASWKTAKQLASILDITPESIMDRDIIRMNVATLQYQYQKKIQGDTTHETN